MSTTSSNPAGPLSVGNVVSAGVRIYRSHFQQYFTQALIAYLWIFVPVYGWAKYSAIAGLISRLAFGELTNQPETLTEARKHTHPRMWSFLGAGILLSLIFIGLYFGALIVFGILFFTGFAVAQSSPGGGVILSLLGLVAFIFFIVVLIRVFSRLMIVEVPLAMEPNMNASGSISRSWELTKGSVGRIQWIVVVAFLITLLVSIPVQIVSVLLQPATEAATTRGDSGTALFLTLINLVVTFGVSILIMPFWQVIKAVIYYDLRTRREGLGLGLRSR